ncbi:MAG: hypothetical protein SFU86_14615 [Pirellulaceae bacterium]|nr:hypothetical protein [Pirellulaceae bacterium]
MKRDTGNKPPRPRESDLESSRTGGVSLQFAKYLVAAVLCVVAIAQNIQAHTIGLTSWKGGGFGLFASHDQLRFSKIYLVSPQGLKPLGATNRFRRVLMDFVACPSEPTGNFVARQIRQSAGGDRDTWVVVAAFDIDYDIPTSTLSCNVLATGDSRNP